MLIRIVAILEIVEAEMKVPEVMKMAKDVFCYYSFALVLWAYVTTYARSFRIASLTIYIN